MRYYCQLLKQTICDPEDAIKSKLTALDFLAYPSVKARMEEVAEAANDEHRSLLVITKVGGDEAAGKMAADATTAATSAADPAAPTTTGGAAGSAESGSAGSADTAKDTPTAFFDQLDEEEKLQWSSHMLKVIRTRVRFIADTFKTRAGLEDAIRQCPLAAMQGDPSGTVIFFYDIKKSGEPFTRPDLRQAPLREKEYTRLVRAVLEARNTSVGADGAPKGVLGAGDIAMIMAGRRHGNTQRLLAPWREGTLKEGRRNAEDDEDGAGGEGGDDDCGEEDNKPGFAHTVLQVAYTEESVARRKMKVRGMASIKQTEDIHVLSAGRLSLPERRRTHFGGTSSGDLLFGVVLPNVEDEWHITWDDKKKMCGRGIIQVGGKTEVGEGDVGPQRRTPTTRVPVCWHSGPEELYAELLYDFYGKLVIDLTPLDGRFAWLCLKSHVAYVGMAFTEYHSQMLESRLLELLKHEMAQPGSRLFNPHYAAALGITTVDTKVYATPTKPLSSKKRVCGGRPSGSGKGKHDKKPKTGDEYAGDGNGDDLDLDLDVDGDTEADMDTEIWDPLANHGEE